MPPFQDVISVPFPCMSLHEIFRTGCGMLLAHSIRGRRRYVCAALRGNHRACRHLEALLLKFPGMTAVKVNPVTGSVTVNYTARETEMNALFDALSPGTAPARPDKGAPRCLSAGPREHHGAAGTAAAEHSGNSFKFAAGLALMLAGAAKILLEHDHTSGTQLLSGLWKILLNHDEPVDPGLLKDLELLQQCFGTP